MDVTEERVQTGYLNALDLLVRRPGLIRGRPLRDVAETLLEANRRAGTQAQRALEGVGAVARMGELKARVESESAAHDDTVAAKVTAVTSGVKAGNAAFAANDLVALTRVDEDIALLCGVVRTSHQTAGLEPPGWLEVDGVSRRGTGAGGRARLPPREPRRHARRAPARADGAVHVARPDEPAQGLGRARLQGGRPRGRRGGGGARARPRGRRGARRRRLRRGVAAAREELNIDRSKVEEVLRNSLLVLAKAPLTVNFDQSKLQLILNSGG